jgi:hypothetical protein
MNNVLEAVGILEEFGVTDFTVRLTVLGGDTLDLLSGKVVTEEDKDLTELFLRDLEMLMAIPVLEERLGIESVSTDDLSETVKNLLNLSLLVLVSGNASIKSLGSSIIDGFVEVLLKSLLGEDFINVVTEVSPANMFTSLGGLETVADKFKFSV